MVFVLRRIVGPSRFTSSRKTQDEKKVASAKKAASPAATSTTKTTATTTSKVVSKRNSIPKAKPAASTRSAPSSTVASVGSPKFLSPLSLRALQAIKIDCSKRIRANEIDYSTVATVLTSWEHKILKIGSDWARPTGISFLRHIFRLEPKTITMFGFPHDTKYNDPKLSSNERFVTKGIRLIKAIDMAASFLGPDLEPLEDELYKLGWRHIAMQAQPEHWPIIGEALFCVFDDCMLGGFSIKERQAWTLIYNFMGFHMIQGLKAHYGKLAIRHAAKVAITNQEVPEIEDLSSSESTFVSTSDEAEVDNSKSKKQLIELSRETLYRDSLMCDKRVPISSISYATVHHVVTSWQVILNIPDWERVTGELFIRYIFKLEPKTIEMFGFPADTDYRDPDLVHDITFMTKGIVLIKAIDTSVQLLGPDLYPLEDIVYDLGKRHVMMQAQPEHWPVIGEALFLVFEECMEGKFTGEVREAWTLIYNFLGYHMIEGLKAQYKHMAERGQQ